MLQEFRCSKCNKLLGKIDGKAEIVCTRCKVLNAFNVPDELRKAINEQDDQKIFRMEYLGRWVNVNDGAIIESAMEKNCIDSALWEESHEMTDTELMNEFERRMSQSTKYQLPAAMIEYQGEKGIALMIGENLATGTWLNGDIIVHWERGKHTMLPEEFTLIKSDIWTDE
ncbi:hypothetical protein ACM1RC_30360 [Paenibacillus azoreducens]|uniref:hypothetical protein n=1 Tax=Paenibacillus azoreducens TaxID=116718 RepID=UPI0039F5429C